jgi:hypothetical protein
MKVRSLTLLVLLVVTSALPLLAAGVACADMPCHRQTGERMMAVMPCCAPAIDCAPAAPEAQPATTAASSAPAIAVIATSATSTESAQPALHIAPPADTSPPPATRERLARLATLLI